MKLALRPESGFENKPANPRQEAIGVGPKPCSVESAPQWGPVGPSLSSVERDGSQRRLGMMFD